MSEYCGKCDGTTYPWFRSTYGPADGAVEMMLWLAAPWDKQGKLRRDAMSERRALEFVREAAAQAHDEFSRSEWSAIEVDFEEAFDDRFGRSALR